MTQSESPFRRSIGLTGLIWWIIAVAAMIAIGAAFSAGRYAMGLAAAVFMIVAAILGFRVRRQR